MGGLSPGVSPSFSQIYIMDGDELQLDQRMSLNPILQHDVLGRLQRMMVEIIPLQSHLKMLGK